LIGREEGRRTVLPNVVAATSGFSLRHNQSELVEIGIPVSDPDSILPFAIVESLVLPELVKDPPFVGCGVEGRGRESAENLPDFGRVLE